MSRPTILLVDDHEAIRVAIADFLEAQGFEVVAAAGVTEARAIFRTRIPDAAVLDYDLGDGDALQLLAELRSIDPACAIIILTGQGSIDLAVRAMREGADHFLTKPVELAALRVILERLLEIRRAKRAQEAAGPRDRGAVDPFQGELPSLRRLAEQARRVVDSDQPVLVLGETGSGKGVLARWLHQRGARAEEPMVDLNCAGLSRELVETELFGHTKGAFTGAVSAKRGMLEVAHRGTVFLDEIGDLDPAVQPKLLKVLEERRFRRVGDVEDRSVDVRLVAATSLDLGLLVRDGKFRSDLYFRISTLVLTIPPLRERLEDLPRLAQELLDRIGPRRGIRQWTLREDALDALRRYPWPGNVRELRNVLERAVLLTDRAELRAGDLHFDPAGLVISGETKAVDPLDRVVTLAEMERTMIARAMEVTGGKVAEAAQRLGIPRSTLYQKLKLLDLPPSKT
jgi:DNA-binding NtrC family response regulator